MVSTIYLQTVFFIVAAVFTLYNIRERFFTKKVVRYELKPSLRPYLQTSVSYFTRDLWQMSEFPLYLTLYPTPGYADWASFGFFSERTNSSSWMVSSSLGGGCSHMKGLLVVRAFSPRVDFSLPREASSP